MTREEAIEWVEGMILYIRDGVNRHMYENAMYLSEEKLEALEMAVEALHFVNHFNLLKEYQSLQEVVQCKDCKSQKTCKFAQWQGDYGYCSNGERIKP